MDVNSKPLQTSTASSPKIDTLDLKINQQVTVKIISSQADTQTLSLQVLQSSQAIQVQSNLPTETKAGQLLQLLVTQLTPATAFKVLNSDDVLLDTPAQIKTKPLIFKQIALLAETPVKTVSKLSPQTPADINIINAKIIAVSSDKIQVQLSASVDSKNDALYYRDRIQNLPLNRSAPTLNPASSVGAYEKTVKNPSEPTTITISKAQLNPVQTESRVSSDKPAIDPFKGFEVGQQLTLEVKKTGQQVDYKIVETKPVALIKTPPLIKQQIIAAKVLDVTQNRIQLSLNHLALNNGNESQHSAGYRSIIDISKTQLSQLPLVLEKGQEIKLEVVKTGQQAEFKILTEQQYQDLKVQQTLKQVLPVQEQPVILLNLLRNKLSEVQENETISKTLKRLAREILENLPASKNIANARQIKQVLSQSGLFMEANLAAQAGKQSLVFQQDFKAQLLRLSHVLKQEITIKQGQKIEANELNLLKELAQKTESTLAKIILNQLASLPKEDVARQLWILDLPFLNQGLADTASIKIDYEQGRSEDEEEQENWSVTITITPPGLETIHCKISCFNKAINTLFWSEQEETVSKINQHLDMLKKQFEQAGIKPGQLSVHQGKAAKETHSSVVEQGLINHRV